MTSVVSSFKQIRADSSHFIAMAAATRVYTAASVATVVTAGTGALLLPGGTTTFAAGTLFKDMGKTVIATLTSGLTLTLRRVQLVDSTSPGTNGITGSASTPSADGDFNVFYVLLGVNGAGVASGDASYQPSTVAKYGV
jgi:hypothetical protein